VVRVAGFGLGACVCVLGVGVVGLLDLLVKLLVWYWVFLLIGWNRWIRHWSHPWRPRLSLMLHRRHRRLLAELALAD
jgi:hypothetical protein